MQCLFVVDVLSFFIGVVLCVFVCGGCVLICSFLCLYVMVWVFLIVGALVCFIVLFKFVMGYFLFEFFFCLWARPVGRARFRIVRVVMVMLDFLFLELC